MAMTAKEIIEGVFTVEIQEGMVSANPDAVTLLSEGKQFVTTVETHKRILGLDGNVLSTVAADGTVTSDADLAKLQDRTYTIESWDFPREERIRVSIPHEKLYQYGINNSTLGASISTEVDMAAVNNVINGLDAEKKKLLRKVKSSRRAQVVHLLSTLEAPTLAWQKTIDGKACVATAAARPDFYTYTNSLALTTLDRAGFNEALDILASSQKNIENDDFERGDFVAGLHATRLSLMMDQVNPSGSVDVNSRSMADAMNGGSKYVGVYLDTDNAADWILLGFDHSIRRLNFGGPGVMDGIKVELHIVGSGGEQEENAYGVEIVAFHRSIMVVDSPIGIVKNVVA